jgi:hypothetical protein
MAIQGSSTTTAACAYLLLLAALHHPQRRHRYCQQIHYIPGTHHTMMADTASQAFYLSNAALVSHFNAFFSAQPLATVPPHFRYAVTSALYRMRWLPSSLHIAPTPPQPHGTHGSPSAMLSTSTPSYQTSLIKFQSYKVLPATTAIDSSPPPNDRSGLARWKMTCVRQVAHSDIQHQHGDQ